jgi:outer membrane immunogenic protein
MFARSVLPALLVALLAPAVAAQSLPGGRDWSGPYAGVSLGVARSDGEAVRGEYDGFIISRDVEYGLIPPRIDGAETALIGGGTLGYNMQRGAAVTGIELDVSFLNQDIRHDFSRIDPATSGPFAGVETNTRYETDFGFLASLRLRAGWTRAQNLFYLTGGLAAAQVRNRLGLSLPNFGPGYSNSWSESGMRIGYVVGAGLERAVGERMSVKVEVLHFDLEDVTVRAEDRAVFDDNRFDYRFKNNGQVLRLGLNMPF